MKMKARILVAALGAVGLIAPLQQAAADTITPPSVTPPAANPNPPTIPSTTTVTYPVTVTLPGGSPQTLNFTFNTANGTWTTPTGWTFVPAPLGTNNTTAEFRTTVGGTTFGITLTATAPGGTGTPTFGAGLGAVTVAPPSVGATLNGVPVTSSVLGAATATGTVTGVGTATAPLVAGTPTTLPVGATGVTVTAGTPIVINPANATASPGSAGGSIVVSAGTNPNPVTFGQYTVTIPTTPTPPGTTTVAGTVAGSTGSFGPGGITVAGISGTASYNTLTGVTTTTLTTNPGFSVNANGNTTIGCAGANTGTTAGLTVCNTTNTNGIVNTGSIVTTTLATTGNAAIAGNLGVTGTATIGGNLGVSGIAFTNGIVNNGTINTTRLNVTGQTTTNGIVNTGTLTTTNLGVTGATTIGSATGTAGNTITVNSTGVSLVSGSQATGSSVTVSQNGATITGNGSSLVLNSSRGAQFSNSAGGPLTLGGIAAGSSEFDAVNFGQFRDLEKIMSRGIASVTALSNIPQVDAGKRFAIGAGVGGFNSEGAVAVGASVRVGAAGIIKASVGTATGSGSKAAYGLGGAWSF